MSHAHPAKWKVEDLQSLVSEQALCEILAALASDWVPVEEKHPQNFVPKQESRYRRSTRIRDVVTTKVQKKQSCVVLDAFDQYLQYVVVDSILFKTKICQVERCYVEDKIAKFFVAILTDSWIVWEVKLLYIFVQSANNFI